MTKTSISALVVGALVLGAAPKQIFVLFLTEAALLSIFGALIGVGVGLTSSCLLLQLYLALNMAPPVWLIVAGAGVAIITGLVFGILPARRAAQPDPVLALARLPYIKAAVGIAMGNAERSRGNQRQRRTTVYGTDRYPQTPSMTTADNTFEHIRVASHRPCDSRFSFGALCPLRADAPRGTMKSNNSTTSATITNHFISHSVSLGLPPPERAVCFRSFIHLPPVLLLGFNLYRHRIVTALERLRRCNEFHTDKTLFCERTPNMANKCERALRQVNAAPSRFFTYPTHDSPLLRIPVKPISDSGWSLPVRRG